MVSPGRRSYRLLIVPVLLAAGLAHADHQVGLPGGVFQITGGGAVSARTLADSLVGCGIQVTDVRFTGANVAAGIFSATGTGVDVIGFEEGLILSSGAIWSVAGPNSSDNTSVSNGQPGDDDLDALLVGQPPPANKTFDATVLEFDFIPSGTSVTFEYVFSSEEYNEFVNSSFNDIFAFFLNGTNVATIPGSTIYVAINSVNAGGPNLGDTPVGASQYYIDNARGSATVSGDPDALMRFSALEMDGLTTIFKVNAPVIQGKINRIKFAVADAGDSVFDSNVFIRTGSFSAGGCGGGPGPPAAGPVAPASTEVYAFPNPFRPGSGGSHDAVAVTLSSVPPGAEIRIYSLTGELVARLEDADGDGTESWDGRNDKGEEVASGIYHIVAVSSPPGGPQVRQRTKLVVVR